MKLLAWALLGAAPLAAHLLSMSTGELRVGGSAALYAVRLPIYEVAHIRDPQRAVFSNLHLLDRGTEILPDEVSCREDRSEGAFLCSARYTLPAGTPRLDVICTLHAATVPNHVHVLRATNGPQIAHAVFDYSAQRSAIRFETLAASELAASQFAAGFARALGGLAQILVLVALALAARSRREFTGIVAAFLLGELAACLLAPYAWWSPDARFLEMASALTLAWVAVEVLTLPVAGKRWVLLAVLGVIQGLYLQLFITGSGYYTAYVLTGAALPQIAGAALFATAFSQANRALPGLRLLRGTAACLLVAGLFWFVLRVKS
jgi:hypothetical protein